MARDKRARGLKCKNICSIQTKTALLWNNTSALKENWRDTQMAASLRLQLDLQHGSIKKRKCPCDCRPLPPSCISFKGLSVCLPPPDSQWPYSCRVEISDWRNWDAVRRRFHRDLQPVNNGVLSCAAACLCQEHGGLCQIGDWPLHLLCFFCWIRTFFCC